MISSKQNVPSEEQIATSLKKRARNANIIIVFILLYKTLNLQFYSFNMLGTAVVKIGKQENIEIWLWIFFSFYTFRYLQEYYFGNSIARLSRHRNSLVMQWTFKLLPKKYEKAFKLDSSTEVTSLGEQVEGEFLKRHLVENKNLQQLDSNAKYIIRVSLDEDAFKYVVIPNKYLLRLYFGLNWVPAFVTTLLSKPIYLTVHLPFIGFLILSLYCMMIN